ncbi:MAG: hypothetical protein MJ212_06420 [Alphaproteobacteria bacterium]|nr:hypothetical protein [Alphaproteobacteria bacterium]
MPIVEYSPANAGEWRNLNYVNTVDFDFNTVSNLLANNNQAVFNNNQAVFNVSVATLQAMANVFGLNINNINNFVNTVMDLRWNQNPNQVLQVTINAVTINQNGIARITIV